MDEFWHTKQIYRRIVTHWKDLQLKFDTLSIFKDESSHVEQIQGWIHNCWKSVKSRKIKININWLSELPLVPHQLHTVKVMVYIKQNSPTEMWRQRFDPLIYSSLCRVMFSWNYSVIGLIPRGALKGIKIDEQSEIALRDLILWTLQRNALCANALMTRRSIQINVIQRLNAAFTKNTWELQTRQSTRNFIVSPLQILLTKDLQIKSVLLLRKPYFNCV